MRKNRSLVVLLLGFSLTLCQVGYPAGQNNVKLSKKFSAIERPARQNELKASFYYSPNIAIKGKGIRFYDVSSGEPDSWCWSFGDGDFSYERNPRHKYLNATVYFVTLQVRRNDKISQAHSAILVKSTANSISDELKANFVFEPENPQAGMPVRFYDVSTGNPNKWTWQFGYFDYSFLKQPVKTFLYEGNYKVTLTVANESGSDRVSKYIEIGASPANIITASSCALADVQAAIAMAKAGDTVVVPNGTAVWNSQLIINKGIILKAQSKGGVRITSGYSYSSNNILDTPLYLIVYNPTLPSNNEPFRITGFVFDLADKIAWLMIKNPSVIPINKIRLDNNNIYNYRSLLMHLWGTVYGVMDNNVVEGGVSWGLIRIDGDDINTWNNLTFEYGTADNFYFEDNNFTATDDTMFFYGDMGGRYCARYNQIRLSKPYYGMYPFADMHGNIPSAWSGTMGAEVYENTIGVGSKGCDLMDIRGGKALVYNNRVTTSSSDFFVQIREEYSDSSGPGPARSPISGQPQHVSDSYFWGNRRNNSYSPGVNIQTLDYSGTEGVVPREDIHYWLEKSNFTGSSGIGVGLLSMRPAVCTKEGVGWWATDENKLYRWHNGQWELYYVPYTYPHPLRKLLSE